jgi:hypothetical protein
MQRDASLLEHLATLPDDWGSWLVFADQLTAAGDERGEMLVLDHRGERDRVLAAADRWLDDNPFFGRDTYAGFGWVRQLSLLAGPRTPSDLKVFAQPLSQLLALIEVDGHDGRTAPPSWDVHRDRVFAAALSWIDRAFPAIPEHGRWQAFSDTRLLDRTEEELEAAFAFYAPAVMSFVLRQVAARKPVDLPWPVHRIQALLSYPHRDAHAVEQQRQRLSALDREQRAAIYAFSLVLDKEPPGQVAWGRVWDAEREGPREDWFALFASP